MIHVCALENMQINNSWIVKNDAKWKVRHTVEFWNDSIVNPVRRIKIPFKVFCGLDGTNCNS